MQLDGPFPKNENQRSFRSPLISVWISENPAFTSRPQRQRATIQSRVSGASSSGDWVIRASPSVSPIFLSPFTKQMASYLGHSAECSFLNALIHCKRLEHCVLLNGSPEQFQA